VVARSVERAAEIEAATGEAPDDATIEDDGAQTETEES